MAKTNLFGEIRYKRNVYVRWPGGAARITSWARKNSAPIDEEMINEDGLPIEEVLSGNTEEVTVEFGVPVGMAETAVGDLLTFVIEPADGEDAAITKDYVIISQDIPQVAGAYVKASFTIRHKQGIDYSEHDVIAW